MAPTAATSSPAPDATLPLAGRVAIVTSASRGMARAIATHLASLGASIVLGSASSSKANALAAELPRAVAVKADVYDEDGVRSIFDAAESAFGRGVDILVTCAGAAVQTHSAFANFSMEEFVDAAFAVNTRGAFLCLLEAANRLRRGGGGRIVAVSSTLASTPLPGSLAYAASKAAVEAMVRVLAKELGRARARVTVNCVAPGPVATDLFLKGISEEMMERHKTGNPMGRLGEVGDIAPVVGFLCTDAAEWVNGQVIHVNRGIA